MATRYARATANLSNKGRFVDIKYPPGFRGPGVLLYMKNPGNFYNFPGIKFRFATENTQNARNWLILTSCPPQRLQFVLGEDFLQGFSGFLQVGRFLFVYFKRHVCLYTVSAHDSRHTKRNTRNAVLAFH